MTTELLRNTIATTETSEDSILLVGFFMKNELGVSIMNEDTGEMSTQVTNQYGIFDMLARYNPSQTIIYTIKEWEPEMLLRLSSYENIEIINVNYFEIKDPISDYKEANLGGQYLPYTVVASQFFMRNYIMNNNPEGIRMYPVRYIKQRDYMYMDEAVIGALDIFESKFNPNKKTDGTLIELLDKTVTAKGSRNLKKYLQEPLVSNKKIYARQLAVEFFMNNPAITEELKEILTDSADLEKILARLGNGRIKPEEVPVIIDTATLYHVFLIRLAEVCEVAWIKNAATNYAEQLVCELERLDTFLSPVTVMTEGFDADFDAARIRKETAEAALDTLLATTKMETTISNLKINDKNEILGYTFDVTKTGWPKVPAEWTELFTAGNTKSYFSPELQELKIELTDANEIYKSVFRRSIIKATALVNEGIGVQQNVLDFVSLIDVMMSLGEVARDHGWSKPTLIREGGINIEEGLNPLMHYAKRKVVRNSVTINDGEVHLVTGSNMGGKTTYLKMVAYLTILAQIGSFVPAKLTLAPVNRIFLRIGASDSMLKNKSTFAKEMDDMSYILHHATRYSLVLLDELGQSTKPKEGIAIAKSILHYLATKIGAKTICTSHYDELAELENEIGNFRNFHMEAFPMGDVIKLTYNLREGASNESYGSAVARTSQLPKEVLAMTNRLLNN